MTKVITKLLRWTIVNRRGTTEEWAASTRILKAGELGYDTTLKITKMGDGVHTWAGLDLFVFSYRGLVRYDVAQALLDSEKSQARANLGLGSAATANTEAFEAAGSVASAISQLGDLALLDRSDIIDDGAVSTTKAWTSNEVAAQIMAGISGLIGAAPGQLDTLAELAQALANDPNFATTISAALALRLRVDDDQSLSSSQKIQARANIGQMLTVDIADAVVTLAKLAVNSVGLTNIIDNSVSTAKLQVGSVINDRVANNAITNTKLGGSAVTNSKIAADTIDTDRLTPAIRTSLAKADSAMQIASEVFVPLGNVSGAINIDLSTASAFTMTLVGDTVVTFTNAPTGNRVAYATIRTIQGGSGNYNWTAVGQQGSFGFQPVLSAAVGAIDEVLAKSWDNGSHWTRALLDQSIS